MNPETDHIDALRSALTQATEPVTATPDLALRSLAGGRRRLRRRRITATTTLAAGTLALAVVATLSGQGILHADRDGSQPAQSVKPAVKSDPRDPYGALLTGTARGGRIHDTAYLRSALRVWATQGGTNLPSQRRGPALVAWAGETPAGPSAVVVQQVVVPAQETQDQHAVTSTAIGFVGVDADGSPALVDTAFWLPDPANSVQTQTTAWFVDLDHTVLGVLDLGSPVAYGTHWSYLPDGHRTMTLTPLQPVDGAAFVRLPGTVDPSVVRVALTPLRASRQVQIAGQREEAQPPPLLNWASDKGDVKLPLTATQAMPPEAAAKALMDVLSAQLTTPLAPNTLYGAWEATGQAADGRVVAVSEAAIAPDRSRAYALISRGTTYDETVRHPVLVDGGPIPYDPQGYLPVAVRLPDGAGWAVVAYHSGLRWRIGTGAWSTVHRDAALIPDAVTDVEVTPNGGQAHVVPLHRP